MFIYSSVSKFRTFSHFQCFFFSPAVYTFYHLHRCLWIKPTDSYPALLSHKPTLDRSGSLHALSHEFVFKKKQQKLLSLQNAQVHVLWILFQLYTQKEAFAFFSQMTLLLSLTCTILLNKYGDLVATLHFLLFSQFVFSLQVWKYGRLLKDKTGFMIFLIPYFFPHAKNYLC